MKTLKPLFDNNRQWAADVLRADPSFFENLAKQQKPKYLWIGCSDSRVPANQIVGLPPGKVFVHRNIANQVLHSDMNCMSVVEYAVDVLQVEHIIVCGHYGCGGVQAALQKGQRALVDNWISHIRDLYGEHQAVLERLPHEQARLDRLCEMNVIEQVKRLCRSTTVETAWRRGEKLCVHGWIYGLENGLLSDLNLCVTNSDEVSSLVAAALVGQ